MGTLFYVATSPVGTECALFVGVARAEAMLDRPNPI
jgi:hypothetical protein